MTPILAGLLVVGITGTGERAVANAMILSALLYLMDVRGVLAAAKELKMTKRDLDRFASSEQGRMLIVSLGGFLLVLISYLAN